MYKKPPMHPNPKKNGTRKIKLTNLKKFKMQNKIKRQLNFTKPRSPRIIIRPRSYSL